MVGIVVLEFCVYLVGKIRQNISDAQRIVWIFFVSGQFLLLQAQKKPGDVGPGP